MSATCEPLLEALKDCLMRSDCVLKKGKLPSECLRQHTDELPDSCKSLRHAVFECKRGLVSLLKLHRIHCGPLTEPSAQVDMRKRFRGNQAAIMASYGWTRVPVVRCLLDVAYRAKSCRRGGRTGTPVGFEIRPTWAAHSTRRAMTVPGRTRVAHGR